MKTKFLSLAALLFLAVAIKAQETKPNIKKENHANCMVFLFERKLEIISSLFSRTLSYRCNLLLQRFHLF